MNTSTTTLNIPAELKDICRTCRKTNKDMRPIFNYEVNMVQVSQMLSFAAAINVRPDDKLPKSLCSPCLKRLIDTYEFIRMCIDSDLEMRNILKNHFKNITDSSTSIIIEKIHNHQQHQNLLPSAAKPLLKSALLKNTEFRRNEIPVQSQSHLITGNDNNTHFDVIEYDGTLIKFENQDYDEFDNFDYGSNMLSDNKNCENMKNKNRNDISRIGKKNIFGNESRIINKNWKCNFCEKEFMQKDDLETHERSHNSVKQKLPEFLNKNITGIKESFSPPSNIKPIGKFSCAFCKTTFHTWENLAKHIGEHKIKSIYGADNPNSPSNLNSSVAVEIEQASEISNECSYCLKRFQYRDDLICHMDEHINENFNQNEYNLQEQTVKLQTIREIPIDIEKEQSRSSENENDVGNCSKFYCQFCPSNYSLKASLRKHILAKHKKKISNLEKYECSYCGRLFIKYLDMIRHRKIHKKTNISKNDKSSAESITPASCSKRQCQYCGKIMQYAHNLKRHIAVKHSGDVANNENTTSTTNKSLKNKVDALSTNTQDMKYKCNDCGKLFNKYLDMIIHRKTLHTIKVKSAITYKCPYCPTLIKWSQANLKRHIKCVHKIISTRELDKTPIIVAEESEPLPITQEKSLNNKLIPIEIFKNLIKCQYCELRLCSKADVQRHMRKMHRELLGIGLKKYDCMYCGKMFKKYSEMRSHQKNHRKRNDAILKPSERVLRNSSIFSIETITNFEVIEEKPSERVLRNSSILPTETTTNFEAFEEMPEIEPTVNADEAADPLEINKGNKSLIPVQCNICSVVLQNIYSYNRHIKQVHGINENEQIDSKISIKSNEIITGFNCKICSKIFKTANFLNTHLMLKHRSNLTEVTKEKSNTITKENIQYNCSECGKSYETLWGLRRHNISLHSDVKHMNSTSGLYECSFCEKRFIKKYSHISHLRIHKEKEEDLRRKCIICKNILKNSIACRRHYRSLHLDKIQENENAKKEDDKFSCSLCSKNFNRNDNYKLHINRHLVTDPKNYSTLKETVVIKSEKKKEKSSILKVVSSQGKQLKKIVKKILRCTQCPVAFSDKKKYLEHIEIHKLKMQRIKEEQINKSNIQSTKQQQELLKKKMREKTFKCEICGKVISSQCNFNSHIAAHERRNIKIEEQYNSCIKTPEKHNKLIKNEEQISTATKNNMEEINLKLELSNKNEQFQQINVPENITKVEQ